MFNKCIKTKVNLYKYPNQIIRAATQNYQINKKPQLTIGDLHANALKFICFLIIYNALEIDEISYNRLIDIYKLTPAWLTKEDLHDFEVILKNAIYHIPAMIRLLGDEFADRGTNDYFILLLFKHLTLHKIPFEILLSNHGSEFIASYESRKKFCSTSIPKYEASSIYNMQELIDRGSIVAKDVFRLIDLYYKPNLKLLSYTVTQDKNSITIYTHAPIDLTVIFNLTKKFKVYYLWSKHYKIKQLVKTIDAINSIFRRFIEQNKVNTLYNHNLIRTEIPINEPINWLMCNRNYNKLKRITNYRSITFRYVHGHDSKVTNEAGVFNLDSALGKCCINKRGCIKAENNVGILSVLFSHEQQLQKYEDLAVPMAEKAMLFATKFTLNIHKTVGLKLNKDALFTLIMRTSHNMIECFYHEECVNSAISLAHLTKSNVGLSEGIFKNICSFFYRPNKSQKAIEEMCINIYHDMYAS